MVDIQAEIEKLKNHCSDVDKAGNLFKSIYEGGISNSLGLS